MKNLFISIKITVAFSLLLCVGYVSLLWGVAAVVTPNQGAAVSVVSATKVVGAAQIGQQFTSTYYFWSRPSAVDYNGSGSGGSNMSIANSDYLEQVADRVDHFLLHHPNIHRSDIPSELVTSSASGLDPHLSYESVKIQIPRVAQARSVAVSDIQTVVDQLVERPLLGSPIINVLKLNVALDEKYN